MRTTSISASALGLMMLLCAAPALAQRQMPPTTVTPPVPSVAPVPPQPQRDMSRPAGPAVGPSTGSVDQRGPAATRPSAADLAALEASIEKRRAAQDALLADEGYKSKVTTLTNELRRRYDVARGRLDPLIEANRSAYQAAVRASVIYDRDGNRRENPAKMAEARRLYEESKQLNARLEKLNRDLAEGRGRIEARKVEFQTEWERDLAKSNEDMRIDAAARDRLKEEARKADARDLQDSKKVQAEADAKVEAVRRDVAIKNMREQAEELDRKAAELIAARRSQGDVDAERAATPLMDEAAELRTMARQMERRKDGLAPQDQQTTTEGLLNSTVNSMGRDGGK